MPTAEPAPAASTASAQALDCAYFDAWRCRSCSLLETPYARQLAEKQARVADALPETAWEPPFASAVAGFRNKAKMAVAGSVDALTLGILAADGTGIDLQACPLHEAPIVDAMPVLEGLVREARLTPYDVPSRRGELKHLVLTASPDGELALRLVLRSTEALPRVHKHLPGLLEALPLASVSVNLQPEHKAVLEGDQELVLHGGTLRMRVGGVPLRLKPRSFFQTNTGVAAGLYAEATAWIGEEPPASLLDLYCGVGGFALHATVGAAGAGGAGRMRVAGVEVAADAIEAARETAAELGGEADFRVGDATAVDLEGERAPELVVVNPPRRGIGALAGRLDASAVRRVVYSSCNPVTLARDLAAMPGFRPVRARLFDMFPHTGHAEVLVDLRRA